MAVVGPTGAGKSLLLRALSLLDPLDAGEVRWRGERIEDDAVPRYRRSAIYLHQRPALFEGTVADNLRLAVELAANRQPFDPQRLTPWLGTLGRETTFLDKPTTTLSGGEAQITAFLRALQLEPEVLFLDEPTAALDRDAAAAIERLVDRWMEAGAGARALLWVSHDPAQAERVSSRRLRIEAGRIAS